MIRELGLDTARSSPLRDQRAAFKSWHQCGGCVNGDGTIFHVEMSEGEANRADSEFVSTALEMDVGINSHDEPEQHGHETL
jgi:hypothetical protein